MTQLGRVAALVTAIFAGALQMAAQDIDYQVYSEPPRLLLNQRRLRLLKRERERESIRWQQLDALMRGQARMSEPGFASALWGTVTGRSEPCRRAGDWALKAEPGNASELRQMALVCDWCASSMSETQASLITRKLVAPLKERPAGMAMVRSLTFAALAVADQESQASQDFLKWAVETWWKQQTVPRMKKSENPFERREDLYAMVEFLHVIRDNLRADLREGANQWFEELAPLQVLSYYPLPWPAAENEFRIPAYTGKGDPDLREAIFSRAAELALVSFDGNAQPHQFLQGWLMQDRFLMRGEQGILYEFLWANPYQPGLSFSYMPDLFHGRGELMVRSGWDEDATWFGFWASQAQSFHNGQRVAIRLDGKPAPLPLGPARVFFAVPASNSPVKFEIGWLPAPEEGEKALDELAFVVGMEPNTAYDVEVDGEEMFEARTDLGGILELKFVPGRKAGVRVRKFRAAVR